MHIDVVIVGGGPAGLSAALVLGRCRRDVVVFDDGNYRNRDARLIHGFLTRDRDTTPEQLRSLARADLEQYPSVRFVQDSVVDVRATNGAFAVLTKSGEQVECRTVLLATGFRDRLPTIGGARELHGDLVVPCVYCDGWEVRDQPLAAFSHPGDRAADFALVVAQWSNDVLLCAEKRPQISDANCKRLERRGVRVDHRELRSVERDGEGLRLIFTEGESIWRRRLFYHLGGGPASNLAERMGAKLDERGSVGVDRRCQSSVPGLFVAGDATRDVLQAVVAAGEGASAGVAINEYLCTKDA